MINILIDGNYIYHKTLGIVAGYGKREGVVLEDPEQQSVFMRKVVNDLCHMISNFPKNSRVIFVKDSKSWRKSIPIENGGYKSSRKKDEDVDWSIFYELFDKFGLILEERGAIYSKCDGAEGDDLVFIWSRFMNSRNENCVIISGDTDLTQLMAPSSDTRGWTIQWTANTKNDVVYVPLNFFESAGDIELKTAQSIFDMSVGVTDNDISYIKKLSDGKSVVEVDPKIISFRKILQGDDGDSVPSVWEKLNATGKRVRLSDGKYDKIIESLEKSNYSESFSEELLHDEEYKKHMAGLILRIFGDTDNSDNRNKLISNISRNMSLVWLDKNIIPKEIVLEVIGSAVEKIEKSSLHINWDRIKFLEGTEWEKIVTPKDQDPFKYIN
jgi:5'-3' exonuclease